MDSNKQLWTIINNYGLNHAKYSSPLRTHTTPTHTYHLFIKYNTRKHIKPIHFKYLGKHSDLKFNVTEGWLDYLVKVDNPPDKHGYSPQFF